MPDADVEIYIYLIFMFFDGRGVERTAYSRELEIPSLLKLFKIIDSKY